MTQITPEMAKVAAKWWADHLRNGSKLDTGDETLSKMAQEKQLELLDRLPPPLITFFETHLAAIIRRDQIVEIKVDYDPCDCLEEAAYLAGINLISCMLPWKTDLWFKESMVFVKVGYGAEPQRIL